MGRVIWSDEAIADADAITDYVADFNLIAAKRLRQALFDATAGLSEFPLKGVAAAGSIRRWSVVYPYAIYYRVSDTDVIVLRVRHGARRQP